MYCLYDTFNRRIVSRHRTIVAVIRANVRMQNRIERNNGKGHYIPTDCRKLVDGEPVKLDPMCDEQATWLYHPANHV